MEIIDEGLEFNSNMSRMGNVNGIVLHHSGVTVPQTVETIHEYHKSKGWAGIGYHYYVRKDGSIYKGRPEEYAGAHCPGVNTSSIGICAEGDFNQEEMSAEQENSIIELVAYVKEEHDIEYVKGHREILATSCPGDNYPLDEIRDAQPTPPTPPEPPSYDQTIADGQQWVNDYGFNIAVDGEFGTETLWGLTCVYQTELNKQFNAELKVDGKFGAKTKAKTPIIKEGASGNITRCIQYMLYCKGYNPNEEFGTYGYGTSYAVGVFQEDHNLSKDGIYGKNTGYKLFN